MTTDKNGNKNGQTNGTSEVQEEEEETEDEEETKIAENELPSVIPPDGGFGWVIVFIGFMSGVIVDGIIFSFGVVFSEILLAFEDGKSKTAWIGSSMAGMYLIVGPVVSALANKYGCRMMTIIGSLIGSVALAASVFATSVNYLILTFGIIGGIGFGFIYLPCIVMVQFYFDKKRAFATGISVCGSGMGAFIFAPLSSYLIGEYGWRGNMLIQSAIVLHMIPLGLLLRPLEVPKKKRGDTQCQPLIVINKGKIGNGDSNGATNTFPKSLSTQSFRTYNNIQSQLEKDIDFNASDEQLKTLTMVPVPTFTIEEAGEDENDFSDVEKQRMNKKFSMDISRQPNFIVGNDQISKATVVKVLNRRKSLPVNIKEEVTRPFYRQDIFFSGSLLRIPDYSSHASLQQYRCSVVSIPKNTFKGNKWRRFLCPKTIRDTMNTMLDFSLLKSVTFVVLCVASFITMTGFFIPFVYLADYALESGISKEDAAFLFSVIGIANTLGRVFSGWVSDRPHVNALVITNIALTTGGLATAFVPFLTTYYLLIVYSAVFGLAIACFASLRSIILVELLGLEKLTNAFGLLLLFQGIASLIGSPMAGFFYDITLSYNASFFIAGGLIALSGVLGFPLPCISKWENNRNKI